MDVADECWRPSCGGDEFEMLLVTSHVANIKSQAPTSNIGHQHRQHIKMVTNIIGTHNI